MSRFAAWIHFRPWLVPSFLLGMVAGVTLVVVLKALPLTRDGIANIVGAGLGAGLAVIGSAWVANGAERRKESAARRAVSDAVRCVELHVIALIQAISLLNDGFVDNERRERVKTEASALTDALNLARERVEGLEPVFLSLGAWGVASRLEMLRRIPYLTAHASEAYYMGDFPSTADVSARARLSAAIRNEAVAILGAVGLRLRGV